MQRDVVIKGRGLGGSSDLTLIAPIRKGFVDSLESVTYKTRVKRVLEALHLARTSSHEYQLHRFLSDSVERVGVIHSVRVAVLEPEDNVLLAVTFDGSWESYIRVLWEKVGTLLDLIFCSTEGYEPSTGSFEAWRGWAHRVQVETGFFYGPPDFSARDVLYHRRIERMRMRGLGSELNELAAVLPSAEQAVQDPFGTRPDDVPEPPFDGYAQARHISETARAGLMGLAGLYRLADLFILDTKDAAILRNAAINLLEEFIGLFRSSSITPGDIADMRRRFARQLDWLFPGGNYDVVPVRQRPPRPALDDASDVQGGILQPYQGLTHGLVLLLSFQQPSAVHSFLQSVSVTNNADGHTACAGTVFRNLAFTPAGLRAAGLSDADLELFPEDFRQGMAARAGSLGDVRTNHPRRWRLPGRFDGLHAQPAEQRVQMSAVHAVLVLRCGTTEGTKEFDALEYWEDDHPLRPEVDQLLGKEIDGLQVLAIQSLRRRYRTVGGQPRIVEHFGYADGDGQPNLGSSGPAWNQAYLGEILCGYNNAADEVDPNTAQMGWLKNGSFLVMRKYHQDVEAFHRAAADAAAATSALDKDTVLAKLMGRDQDGVPLAHLHPPGGPNDFTYRRDPRGELCPLHAHIRRANPRTTDAARPPRIMRRSMSYGPEGGAPGNDRGLLFMAFNSSFSEQFEVIQRWLVGGNSTGSSSGQSCPIVGVPENGVPRHYRFRHDVPGEGPVVANVQLDKAPHAFMEAAPFTRLEWGLYLFAPSLAVIARISEVADNAPEPGAAAHEPWDPNTGSKLIGELLAHEREHGADSARQAWKAALEDPASIDRLDAAAIWAAIRRHEGGVLRTPYGVLVARRELIHAVLADKESYSMSGQRQRMLDTGMGHIYLGKDDGKNDGTGYADESRPVNLKLMDLDPGVAFRVARDAAARKLADIVQEAKDHAIDVGSTRFEVAFDAREILDEVLADLTDHWFGLHLFSHLRRGGTDWQWEPGSGPPSYPGHLMAQSRFMFQPNPGEAVEKLATLHGHGLRKAMLDFVADYRQTYLSKKDFDHPPVTAAIFGNKPFGDDDEYVATTMIGVMMGYTPTIFGALLNVLKEWHPQGRFEQLRMAHAASPAQVPALVDAALRGAAGMRPMPQLLWRTVRSETSLDGGDGKPVQLVAGDRVVLALVSGTQQSLADGQHDGLLMFGGARGPAGHPTHACPGYHAAMAAMQGTLTALLATSEDIRTGTTPFSFEVRGETGFELPPDEEEEDAQPPQVAKLLEQQEQIVVEQDGAVVQAEFKQITFVAFHAEGAAPPEEGTTIPEEGSREGLVLAWGDSWLGYFMQRELRDWLEVFGYTVPEEFCGFGQWLHLSAMEQRKAEFKAHALELLSEEPVAIVLSGAGNDSVNERLETLLNRAGATEYINKAALSAHLAAVENQYTSIIRHLREAPAVDLPIILHAYDHPVPNNDSGFPVWIRKPFHNMGYKDPARPADPRRCDTSIATRVMKDLIDALNETVAGVARANANVHYVSLRGCAKEASPADAGAAWANDLHLKKRGFQIAAARISAEIEKRRT